MFLYKLFTVNKCSCFFKRGLLTCYKEIAIKSLNYIKFFKSWPIFIIFIYGHSKVSFLLAQIKTNPSIIQHKPQLNRRLKKKRWSRTPWMLIHEGLSSILASTFMNKTMEELLLVHRRSQAHPLLMFDFLGSKPTRWDRIRPVKLR